MAHLRPCTACARHVRANVTACPFCDAQLALEEAAPALAPDRLGRAARMAFGGAAVVAIVVGCAKEAKQENIAMPYGAPPNPSLPDTAPPEVPIVATADATAPMVDAAAMPVADAAAKPIADAGKKATPKPTAVPPPPPPNVAKPYGAPPADGYDVFEV